MCGIVGALRFDGNGFRVTEPYITTMREQVVHRGPDGGDTWVDDDGRVGLGFRRLAIIDLSDAAMQPMANEDGSIRLVFNGEIYNHAEIRAELEALGGHTLADRPLRHGGDRPRLRAVGDRLPPALPRHVRARDLGRAHAGALARPRPRSASSRSTTASTTAGSSSRSEIKALLQDPGAGAGRGRGGALPLPLVPDDAGAADALPRDQQAARRDVDAGHRGRRDPRAALLGRAGTTPSRSPACPKTEIAERVLDELRTSVQLRKVSDVPVGVFLSGGIDSSTNAALFSEGERDTVKTFSIGYEGEYDELQERAPLRAPDGRARRRRAPRAAADAWTTCSTSCRRWSASRTSRSPTRSASPSTTSRSSRATTASSSRQVGEGADELFWGYPAWKVYRNLQRYDDLPVPSRR